MGDFTKEFEKGLASHTAQLDPLISCTLGGASND